MKRQIVLCSIAMVVLLLAATAQADVLGPFRYDRGLYVGVGAGYEKQDIENGINPLEMQQFYGEVGYSIGGIVMPYIKVGSAKLTMTDGIYPGRDFESDNGVYFAPGIRVAFPLTDNLSVGAVGQYSFYPEFKQSVDIYDIKFKDFNTAKIAAGLQYDFNKNFAVYGGALARWITNGKVETNAYYIRFIDELESDGYLGGLGGIRAQFMGGFLVFVGEVQYQNYLQGGISVYLSF